MKFFLKRTALESEKNGTIVVREFLWLTTVFAGGFEQSGPYVAGLWRNAVQKIHNPKKVSSVLVLGLCVGNNVGIAEKRFPHAHITAVEWDRVMIDIALKLHRFKTTPEIIHGDLRDVLPTLTQTYDVILSDAFYGDQPDVGAESNTTGVALVNVLAPGGIYILNASRTPASIEYISTFLNLKKKWKFRDNTIAMFTQK